MIYEDDDEPVPVGTKTLSRAERVLIVIAGAVFSALFGAAVAWILCGGAR